MSENGAEARDALPDFIIGGAMKSATSSLHHLLAQHERVFIPDGEVHFFCMDDLIQHPDFFSVGERDRVPDYERDFGETLEWYRDFFRPAQPHQLIGEDSTLYLAAPDAPRRIADLLPDVKLLFMLRNPVERTYSHYWHRVYTGRAVFPFEQELERGSSHLHLRSFYKPQLERYFDRFPRSQIKVVIFERFVEHTQAVVDEVCSFLDLPGSIDIETADPHSNKSPVPRLFRTQLLFNYLMAGWEDRYDKHLPDGQQSLSSWFWEGVVHHLRRLNLRAGPRPPMTDAVRARLAQYYGRKNRGLSDLIGTDVSQYWPALYDA
jgi:hypothetical protein